ncbi:hypothetical protein TNCV_1721371 [Trichonephila clavipes]|nr:hypothetical protein TNCV_1721371 [Trichonephila clavipes]
MDSILMHSSNLALHKREPFLDSLGIGDEKWVVCKDVDQKRMVLLPEEVGEKGFLESRSPTFRIDSSGKGMRRTGFEGPDWRQKA